MGQRLSCPQRQPAQDAPEDPAKTGPQRPAGESAYWETVLHFWADQLPPAMGTFLEGYEVVIYGYMSEYIAVAFFNGSQALSWLAFALSFVARPFGGLLFGRLTDHSGRRTAMLTSLYLSLGATVGGGLAPNVPYLGPLWVLLCRVLQGAGLAGQMGAVAVLLCESAPRPALAHAGAIIEATGALGFVSAVAVSISCTTLLSPAQMQSWGWRLPFLITAAPGAFIVYVAHWTSESPDFELAHRDPPGESLPEAPAPWSARWTRAVLSQTGALFGHTTLYLTSVYLPVWLVAHCHLTKLRALTVTLGAQGLGVLLMVPSCWLADTFGLAKANVGLHVFAMASAVPMYAALARHCHSGAVLVLAGAVVPAVCGTIKALQYSWMCEFFPFETRGAGFSLNFSTSVVNGGLTPLICGWFGSVTLFPAYYMAAVSGVSLTAFVISLMLHEAHKEDPRRLQVVHLRAEPY